MPIIARRCRSGGSSLTAFGVLFAAEWGDASQIATAGLVARQRGFAHAVATGVGAWLALVLVAGLAVVPGRVVLQRVPLHLVHRFAGALFAAFAVLAAGARDCWLICAAEAAESWTECAHCSAVSGRLAHP